MDRGIEESKRNTIPFITDEDGKLVFIPGIGISELFKIDDNTVTILHFSYR